MKILVSDYDRTFDLDENMIKKNIESIKEFQNKGNIFVFATGRSYYDFLKKKDKYNLIYDYVLLNHGATILDNEDNVLDNYPINENYLEIKKYLKLEKSIMSFCCSKLDSRVDFNHSNLTKIAVRYLPFVNIKKIKEELDNNFSSINSYMVSTNMLEIVSKDISKDKAIELLIKKLKIKKKDVYTIGDSYTDYLMIKKFNGYCVPNANIEIKEIAKEVLSIRELINEII